MASNNLSFFLCSGLQQVGLSGSGKTSLVSLILRFYDVGSGSIKLGGHDIAKLDPSYLRAKVATVPQEPALFSVSMHDNIAYGLPDVSRAEVETAATLANAHAFISAMPNGFDTVVGSYCQFYRFTFLVGCRAGFAILHAC